MNDESVLNVIRIMLVILGVFAILYAVFGEKLLGPLKPKSRSELFQNPRFQRSAQVNEKLIRLFMLPFGMYFLLNGIGQTFLSAELVLRISWVFVGLAFLFLIAIICVTIINWRG